MASPNPDLNDVITSAVKARVEASVLEALSGDEYFGQMIATSLSRPVEVPSQKGYGKDTIPFMSHVLESTIRQAVQDAVRRLVIEQASDIEDAVRKELKRSVSDLAKQLVGSVSSAAESAYGINVELKYRGRGD